MKALGRQARAEELDDAIVVLDHQYFHATSV